MGLTPILRLLLAALLLVAGGNLSAWAQAGYPQQYRDPRAYPPGYYPGKLVQPAQPQQQPGFSFRRLFTPQEEAAPPSQTRRPVVKRRKPPPAPAAVVKQEKPKPNPTTHVMVFGDSLADFASQGLDDMYSDDSDVAVVRKTKGESGLTRDAAEWPGFIRETLDSGQKASLAVVMLGANDRQSIREGEANLEPLSDRWTQVYRLRVDAVLRTFQERSIPVIWIGLPPMKNGKLSEDLVAMNEIYRESVQRLGATYVDIWQGFVDDDNRYTATGPDVDGELAKLRTNDGVSFTRAGARKLAHFAKTDIDRLLESGAAAAARPAAPAGGEAPAATSIEGAIPAPPQAAVPVALPVKPLVGPVLPLTRADLAPGGALASGAPKMTGDHAYPVQRALRAGVPPSVKPGRADDFRWPSE
ncbi:DUF459 domain-containing protein [Microvirga aerophila]|uniref:Uncharacterized protein n=1 Tax=Microvirga aerophila TaxID=670291 RepID=A0A512BN54_9HYPH|nr:SGNH family hydrolase [Microvirga aerophila]GEO13389.1 hypothetical protein MAE02_10850 [Microvirga aerophila]